MAVYQLWAPWTPLDECFQWLRGTTPKPLPTKHPFRASQAFLNTLSDLEVQLCFQELSVVLENTVIDPAINLRQPHHGSEPRLAKNKKDVLKPQPIRLNGVDSVFGRIITAQPPKWTGTFKVSDKSAFSKIISREHKWPTGLKEPQIQVTIAMCKQMLRSILLLYATYKKCTFVLQHSK
ncbi:FANCD2 opposite strand protein [Ambystoma mexicanum]|uniref:FANCD2 opposite strand protein n=1 Tax=Ambystoma mexicanum TaxID=8296 RepID=UPI0037E7B2C8